MNFIIISSQIISFVRRNNPQKNRKSWLLWRELVERIYEFDIAPNQIKLFINQGKGSFTSVYKSKEDITESLKSLSKEEQTKIITLVKLYFTLEVKEKEQLNINYQNEIWNWLVVDLKLTNESLLSFNSQIGSWLEKHEDNRFFTPINIKASLIPINLDFFLRCVLLWIYNTGGLKWSKDFFESDYSFYLLANIIIVTVTIFLFALIRGRIVKNRTVKLFRELNIKRLKLNVKKSAWNYTLIFLYIIVGIFINASIDEEMPLALAIFIGIFHGVYLLIILNIFSKKVPQSKEVLTQLELIESKNLDRDLTHEENDEEIINLEVKLRSINEQMEAFVLEAALFGALAFSGFLSIIASDVFSISIIESFSKNIGALLRHVVAFNTTGNVQLLNDVLSKEGLLALMCYETLFCSIFFLSVIASRLRFNDLTDFVDRSLQISKSINEREEELVNNAQEKTTDGKIKKLSKKIRSHLRFGNLKYEEIGPIMEYMKFFRTLGISTFFIIIITGGLFISVELSIVMLFISILSLFYFKLKKVAWIFNSINIRVQEFYFTNGKYVNRASWLAIIIAFILRSLGIPMANLVMLFGFIFLCLHHLFSLFIPEIIEDENKSYESNAAYLKLLKKTEKIGMAFFYLGFMFKAMHWPGAGAMLVFGLLFLSGYFFISPKNTGAKWMDILFSAALGIWFLGVLFKFMHWAGGSTIEWVGTIAIIIAGLVAFLYRNQLTYKLKRVVFILFTLTILLQSTFVGYAITHMNLNYSDYTEYKEYKNLRFIIYNTTEEGGFANPQTQEQNDSLQVYLKRFSSFILNRERYSHDLYGEADAAYRWSNDEIVLNEALLWIKKDISSDKTHYKMEVYVGLLVKLKQWEQAESIALETHEIAKQEGRETTQINNFLTEIREQLEK